MRIESTCKHRNGQLNKRAKVKSIEMIEVVYFELWSNDLFIRSLK